jgi:hypothetical protein
VTRSPEPAFDPQDRETFEALAEILRTTRCADGVSLQRRTIIVVRWTKVAGPDVDTLESPADSPFDLRV